MAKGPPPKRRRSPAERARATHKPKTEPAPVVRLASSARPPEPPAGLSEAAAATWERLWLAGAAWLDQRQHLDLVRVLVELLEERDAIVVTIATDGPVVAGSTGQPRPHPMYARLGAVESSILRYAAALGLPPVDLARVQAKVEEEETPLAKLLARKLSEGTGEGRSS